jgi:hypothetical protein
MLRSLICCTFLILGRGLPAIAQDDPELEKLKAQNALLAQQLQLLQNQQAIQALTNPPGDLKQLQDQNALLAEKLKLATNTKALSDASTPANSQLQRLTDENAILDQQLKQATSTQSLAAASVPKFTGGQDGTTTISGEASVESVQLAYEALGQAAKGMADDIQHCGPQDRIMIFNAGEIGAFDSLNAFRLQTRMLNDLLKQTLTLDSNVLMPAPGPKLAFAPLALMMAGPMIQSLIDFTKLFRVNREITTKDLTPDDKAFLSILATRLAAKAGGGCRVYHPELVPASVFQELTLPPGNVPASLDQINQLTAYLGALHDESGPASLSDWFGRIFDKTTIVRIRALARADEKTKVDQEIDKASPDVKKWRDLVASIPTLNAAVAALTAKVADLDKKLKPLQDARPVDKPAVTKAQKALDAAKTDLDSKTKDRDAAVAAGKDNTLIAADDELRRKQRYTAELGELLKALNAALDSGNAFRADLLKGDGAGANLLSRLTRSSRLENELKTGCPDGCYSSILHISVQKLSAATLKKTGTFTGTKYTFSGGAIATYLQFGLWEHGAPLSGALSGQGTFTGYSGQHIPAPETPLPPVGNKKLGVDGNAKAN